MLSVKKIEDKIDDLDTFVSLFFKTPVQKEQAIRILLELQRRHMWPRKEWKQILIASAGIYTKVIKRLQELGLITRFGPYYALDTSFEKKIIRVIEFWDEFVAKSTGIKIVRTEHIERYDPNEER